jgi:hypothetical protein
MGEDARCTVSSHTEAGFSTPPEGPRLDLLATLDMTGIGLLQQYRLTAAVSGKLNLQKCSVLPSYLTVPVFWLT